MGKRFKKTKIFAAVVTAVIFVLLGAANGVPGELGVSVFQWLQQLAGNLIAASSLPWLIIVLIVIAALVSVLMLWQRDKHTLSIANISKRPGIHAGYLASLLLADASVTWSRAGSALLLRAELITG